MAGSIQQLFDNLAEGLAILSEAGVVRFANAAFTQSLGATLGQKVSNVLIEQAIRECVGGYKKLPIRLTVAPAIASPFCRELQVTLLASPFGPGYALVVRNPTMEGRYETVVANLAELLARAVDEPLKAMQTELALFDTYLHEEPDCLATAAVESLHGSLVRIRGEGDLCIGRLRQLATFASSFAHAPIIDNERIEMMEFRSALIQRLRPLLQRYRVAMKCIGFDADLPVVYGSMPWLVEALAGYLEYSLHAASVIVDFQVRLRGFGNFVLISVESGSSYVLPHERKFAFSPFVGAVRRAPGAATEQVDVLGLGLPLCKRIVDLHGGHVRLEQEGSQQAFRFEIELPCGDAAGNRQIDQMGLEQARRYAEDMASMVRRYRSPAERLKPKGASSDIASQRNENLGDS